MNIPTHLSHLHSDFHSGRDVKNNFSRVAMGGNIWSWEIAAVLLSCCSLARRYHHHCRSLYNGLDVNSWKFYYLFLSKTISGLDIQGMFPTGANGSIGNNNIRANEYHIGANSKWCELLQDGCSLRLEDRIRLCIPVGRWWQTVGKRLGHSCDAITTVIHCLPDPQRSQKVQITACGSGVRLPTPFALTGSGQHFI